MNPSPCRLIAGQSLRFVLREHIVAFLVLLFVSLVTISAWLGWSATSTVDHIYTDAAAFLAASNQPVPTNPVLDISPLSLMRNMSIYVALIGVLASTVIGNQLVSLDRKSGVVPLIATRALSFGAYAAGKVVALTLLVLGLTITVIARKDVLDASRDRFILIVTAFLAVAALASLVAGAIALSTDVATYNSALATLTALGKTATAIRAPEFYPLRLLRGAIEQIEIVGAVIAILIGYRAAASERGRQTLALIMPRPVHRWQFLAAKALAGVVLLAGGLLIVLFLCAVALHLVSGVGLDLADLGRIALVWAVSVAYTACFFLVSFMLTLTMKRPSHGQLSAINH